MKKYQIFISSTYLDLIKERQQAAKAIIDYGHLPAGMELFVADNIALLNTIYEWIENSDVFILLVGARYGSIGTIQELSYTELELQHAISQKIPIYILMLTEKEKSKRIKNNPLKTLLQKDNQERYGLFLEMVNMSSFTKGYFEDSKDVFAEIGKIIRNIEIKNEVPGWVRESSVRLNLLRKPIYQTKQIYKSKTIAGYSPYDDRVDHLISDKTQLFIDIFKPRKDLKFVCYFEYQDEKGNYRWVGFNNTATFSHKQGQIEQTRQVIDQDSTIHTLRLHVKEEIAIAFPDVKNNPHLIRTIRFRGDGSFENEEIEFNYLLVW